MSIGKIHQKQKTKGELDFPSNESGQIIKAPGLFFLLQRVYFEMLRISIGVGELGSSVCTNSHAHRPCYFGCGCMTGDRYHVR